MILLTGAKGFVASAISKRLDSHIAFDKDDCDLTDYEQVKQLPDNITEVWHFAAYNNTKHFYSKPFDVLDNTLSPTLNLLKRYPNARFVYASSSEVYAGAVTKGLVPVPTPEVNISLIDGIDNPRWSYAGSKLLGEIAVHSAHVQNGIDYLILRYHNVYGAEQQAHFIPEFLERAKQGDLTLPGAHQTRAFCYIDDAAELTTIVANTAHNETVHIGNPTESTIQEVAQAILSIANIKGTVEPLPEMPGSVDRRCADVTRMLELAGDYEFTDLQQGLRASILS